MNNLPSFTFNEGHERAEALKNDILSITEEILNMTTFIEDMQIFGPETGDRSQLKETIAEYQQNIADKKVHRNLIITLIHFGQMKEAYQQAMAKGPSITPENQEWNPHVMFDLYKKGTVSLTCSNLLKAINRVLPMAQRFQAIVDRHGYWNVVTYSRYPLDMQWICVIPNPLVKA